MSGARNLLTDKLQILRRAAAIEEMFVFSTGAKKVEGGGKRLNKCKKKKKKASLFTQLQALFEGLDDNRERSGFSATEQRGEFNVWQQVFSETRKVGIQRT